METDFPEIEERFAADAWREPVYVEHRITHEDLTAATEAWLAAGGCITQVASGLQNSTSSSFNSRIVSTSVAGLDAAEKQRARELSSSAQRIIRDMEWVAQIKRFAADKPNRRELSEHLGVSVGVLRRLMDTYLRTAKETSYLRTNAHYTQGSVDEAGGLLRGGHVVLISGDEMKRCKSCGETKPTSQFYGDSGRACGVRSHCIECERASVNARNQARREAQANEQPSAA